MILAGRSSRWESRLRSDRDQFHDHRDQVRLRHAGRTWDLAADVADNVQDANPHADKLGNAAVWSFVEGPTRPTWKPSSTPTRSQSLSARWLGPGPMATRRAGSGKSRPGADKLAEEVKTLLSGAVSPVKKKSSLTARCTIASYRRTACFQRGLDVTRFAARISQTMSSTECPRRSLRPSSL